MLKQSKSSLRYHWISPLTTCSLWDTHSYLRWDGRRGKGGTFPCTDSEHHTGTDAASRPTTAPCCGASPPYADPRPAGLRPPQRPQPALECTPLYFSMLPFKNKPHTGCVSKHISNYTHNSAARHFKRQPAQFLQRVNLLTPPFVLGARCCQGRAAAGRRVF